MVNKKILIIGFALVMMGIASMGTQVYAKNEGGPKAYKSGYNHGCDDVGLPANQKYINQDEKGPAYHSQDFMNGYYDGYASCQEAGIAVDNSETNTAVDDSFNNRDSVVQPQSQTAVTTQSNSCPQQIINGDCYTSQSQNTANHFAQANRADN